jgi:hypothetical protein
MQDQCPVRYRLGIPVFINHAWLVHQLRRRASVNFNLNNNLSSSCVALPERIASASIQPRVGNIDEGFVRSSQGYMAIFRKFYFGLALVSALFLLVQLF